MKAESPGPSVSKLVPKLRETAIMLYKIYLGLTIMMVVLYLIGGMPLFDSIVHTFGTAGTGGFGIKGDQWYNPSGEYIKIKVSLTENGKMLPKMEKRQSLALPFCFCYRL